MRLPMRGFTLVELMVVVVIVAIFAAIAIPSYQAYARRAMAAAAQQEIQRLAEQLERHKGKNFSYRGFDPSYLYTGGGYDAAYAQVTLPLNAVAGGERYILFLKDISDGTKLLTDSSALGQRWAIKAESKDPKNFSFLMTSTGIQCKNKTTANVGYTSCGTDTTGSESW